MRNCECKVQNDTIFFFFPLKIMHIKIDPYVYKEWVLRRQATERVFFRYVIIVRYGKIFTASAMAIVSELMFWSAWRVGSRKMFCIWPFSSADTWISNTRGAFFSTQTVAVCFESACVESMAECQSLDRDGATAVTELSSSDSGALKSGGNPLPTAHDVITLTTARGGGQ